MFCMLKKKKIYPAYVSKHNSNREKQLILLTISNGEKWNYLVVKKLSALFRITSKHQDDFYCLNRFHSFATENKLQSHIRAIIKIKRMKIKIENKDFCNVNMLSEDTKILECNQYQKFDKAPFIILCI